MTATPVREHRLPIAVPVDIDTPAAVVDLRRLDRNLAAMQSLADDVGVALRPHAKTHKCTDLARRQLAAGAVGLTVATLSEAETFAAAGCRDVFVAYPIWAGGPRAARLRGLHERTTLSVGVDGVDAAAVLAAAVRGAARPLRVLVEVDSGQRRSGVSPDAAGRLASQCAREGLDVIGVFTHPGHVYAHPRGVAAAAADEAAALRTAVSAVATALTRPVDSLVVSGGSTPTVLTRPPVGLTEIRPGTYALGDRQQLELGRVDLSTVAFTVAARVVSRPRPGEAVLDAGSKALSSDRPTWLDGFGLLPAHPEATLSAVTEEHAVVTGLADPPAVGDVVAVVPNHVCTAVNLASQLLVAVDGEIVDVWRVDARR